VTVHAGDACFGVRVLVKELGVHEEGVLQQCSGGNGTKMQRGKAWCAYIIAQLKGLSSSAKPYLRRENKRRMGCKIRGKQRENGL